MFSQYLDESFFCNLDIPNHLHPFLALRLALEELHLPGHVAAVALCGDIFPQRFDVCSRQHLASHCSLDLDVELLSEWDIRNQDYAF